MGKYVDISVQDAIEWLDCYRGKHFSKLASVLARDKVQYQITYNCSDYDDMLLIYAEGWWYASEMDEEGNLLGWNKDRY